MNSSKAWLPRRIQLLNKQRRNFSPSTGPLHCYSEWPKKAKWQVWWRILRVPWLLPPTVPPFVVRAESFAPCFNERPACARLPARRIPPDVFHDRLGSAMHVEFFVDVFEMNFYGARAAV